VAVVNGRLSERSFRGYRRVRWLTRRVFPLIDGFLMQSEADADRVRQLGAPADRVQVAGSAKYDINGRDAAAEAAAEAALRAAGVPGSATVLLGGSTWPGEEEVLLYVYARLKPLVPELVLALAPRHVERTPEVLAAIAARQLTVVRRSAVGTPAAGAIDVFLLDTTGELKAFYAHADVIFVGKSLTQHGGQNVIEPAVYGKAIVTGPNMENFAAIMGEFLESEAVLQVADAAGLMETVQRLLTDPEAARQLGERAQAVLAKNAGAVDRSVAQLMPLMAR
jgi:3-deoxy-D-manno-octulosonic-acid transferase